MTRDIIKTDSRLLLFRALEFGLKEKLLDDTFLDKLKKEGSQMSFAFAKKYYNVIHEAYLRQASHCVLGIINIGLIELTDNRFENAAVRLIQEGSVGLFREGWTRILNLVKHARKTEKISRKTAFEWEKDFAESFSAEPDREWIGHDEYLMNMIMYCNRPRGKYGTD